MARDSQRRPLGGPWLRIARRVKAGNNDVPRLKLCASDSNERSQLQGNLDAMIKLGFLTNDAGLIELTPLGESLIP